MKLLTLAFLLISSACFSQGSLKDSTHRIFFAPPIPGKIDTVPSLMLCTDTAYTDYVTGLDSNIQQHYSPWPYQVFGYALMKHPDTYTNTVGYYGNFYDIPWCIGYLDRKKHPLKYFVWQSVEIKTPAK